MTTIECRRCGHNWDLDETQLVTCPECREPSGLNVSVRVSIRGQDEPAECWLTRIPGVGECIAIKDDENDEHIYSVTAVVHVGFQPGADLDAELYVHEVKSPVMEDSP